MTRFSGLFLLCALAFIRCDSGSGTETFTYTPLSAIHFHTHSQDDILGFIADDDQDAINQHSWDLWKGLTYGTGQIYQGQELVVYETWFSGSEIFVDDPVETDSERTGPRDFEDPKHFFHRGTTNSEPVTAFTKFSVEYAEHVWDNEYNAPDVLTALNASWTEETATEDRSIEKFPFNTVAAKPVLMLVKATGLTAIPYWDGADNSTNPATPGPTSWNQCVAVDADGTRTPGDIVSLDCNGVTRNQTIFPLSDFHSTVLTSADIANLGESTSEELAGAEPGDYAILVAMHITSKVIPQWGWQTFWWVPDPEHVVFPAEQRSTEDATDIIPPFDHFAMCNAYVMMEGDEPKICFNPYLETTLTDLSGIESNCMTCHALATWGDGTGDFGNGLDYQVNGEIALDGPEFADMTQLDFLWSVTRAAADVSPSGNLSETVKYLRSLEE